MEWSNPSRVTWTIRGYVSAEKSREQWRAALAEEAFDHRLDLRADLIRELVDEQAIVGGGRAEVAEIDGRTELDVPLARQRQEASGTEPRKRGRDGDPRDADVLREPRHLAEHRCGFFGTDDGDRNDRRAGAQRELDEAAAPEPLQAVAILPQLAHAFFPLGEHGDELAFLQQALGVFGIGAHAADAVHERPEEGQVKDRVLDEWAHVAARRMIAPDRVHDHGA